jgi:hypothetical protein
MYYLNKKDKYKEMVEKMIVCIYSQLSRRYNLYKYNYIYNYTNTIVNIIDQTKIHNAKINDDEGKMLL